MDGEIRSVPGALVIRGESLPRTAREGERYTPLMDLWKRVPQSRPFYLSRWLGAKGHLQHQWEDGFWTGEGGRSRLIEGACDVYLGMGRWVPLLLCMGGLSTLIPALPWMRWGGWGDGKGKEEVIIAFAPPFSPSSLLPHFLRSEPTLTANGD